ncbi:integral membrane family protein [Paraphaeosphaeria minitans]|uniref:Integral membrane family protein n=1 Tax=Paraphaeosphaeria minitans TaxID=565426 RepID=A0A9P6GGT5_9PLEO|nr:integral membrane family protein [Paraphaeosphaeria minitans]
MAVHDPESFARRGEQLESITIAHITLSWLFIALRAYTRVFVKPNFGWDDLAMIFAGMIYTVYCAFIFYIEAHGGGTHVTSVAQLSDLTKRAVGSEATYIATVMMLKISVGILFARIVVQRWQLVVIYTTIVISCISASASFFYCLFRCGPDLDEYVMRQLSYLCTPRGLDRFFAYQHAAFAFSTDCVFVLLPIPLLWNTNMSRKSKFSIGFILSLATLGCVCSAIRFRYVDGLTQIEDFFWNATNISIWSTIEPGVGIMAGCMATLRPLIKCAHAKVQTLRSSRTLFARNSHLVEIGMNSSNEERADSRSANIVQYSKDAGLTSEDRRRDGGRTRISHSTGQGSTECILSPSEEKHTSEQSKRLELNRTNTWTSVSPDCSDLLPPLVPTLQCTKSRQHDQF